MKVEVINIKGESTGRTVELPAELFGVTPNEHVVYLAVKQYLAHQRQGTHKSKERSELSGSTRKLHRQKGTGGSRKGDINSPTFRGGARVFGPRVRDYDLKLPKKVKALARASALSAKFNEGFVKVIEDFTFETPKTKQYLEILTNLKLDGQKTLLVTSDYDKSVYLSARNLPKAEVSAAKDLNTYQVMNAGTLLFNESAVNKIG